MFSKDTLKTDLALVLPMVAGFFAYFHLHLNVVAAVQVASELIDALFVIVPAMLLVFHDLQRLKILQVVPATVLPAAAASAALHAAKAAKKVAATPPPAADPSAPAPAA